MPTATARVRIGYLPRVRLWRVRRKRNGEWVMVGAFFTWEEARAYVFGPLPTTSTSRVN